MTLATRLACTLALLTLATLPVAACGGASSPATATGSGKPEKTSITVGLPVAAETLAPVYVAVDKGYFKQQGLTVSLVTFHGGSELVKAVLGGSVDIGVTGPGDVFEAVQQGQAMKVFYGGFDTPDYYIIAKPPIDSIAATRGKTWGISAFGSTTDVLARYILKRNGIPVSDVNITQTGGGASTMAALQADRIQVMVLQLSQALQAKDLGYNVVLPVSTLFPTFPLHAAFAMQDFLSRYPNTTTAFLRGLVKGMEETKSSPETAAAEIVKYHVTTQKYALPTIQGTIKQLYPDGRLPDAKSMNAYWQMGIESGIFTRRLPDSTWLDAKWIKDQSWRR